MIVRDYLKAFIGPPNVVRVIRELQKLQYFDQMTVTDALERPLKTHLGGLSKGVFLKGSSPGTSLNGVYCTQFNKRKRALPIGQKMSSDQGMDLENTDFHIMFLVT